MSTIIVKDRLQFDRELGKLIESQSNEAINTNGIFKVGISGGSLVEFVTSILKTLNTDLSKWRIFFCDERIAPVDSADSTFGAYTSKINTLKLTEKIDIQDEQFIQIKQGVTAEEAAVDYIKQMEKYFVKGSLPVFDLLLLGMGPDGHTCSLFPNHPLLKESNTWIAPITDSPKPPPSRITLTLPVINNAKAVVFAMMGKGKAEMVKRIKVDKENLPATMVKPTEGKLFWILDENAAHLLI